MSTRYFFFGTLMDRDVLELVLARPLDGDAFVRADLGGYRRVRVRKDTFPMLVEDPSASVPGIVFETRSAEEDARILFFEDFDYDLAPCRPMTKAGPVDAMFCGTQPEVEASDDSWSLDAWAERYKPGFLRLSKIYMDCYGRLSTEEAEPIWEQGRQRLIAEGLL
jgi:hypothetical protein